MNWMLKAAVQSLVSLLPSRWSHSLYYRIQRRFGNLRDVSPTGVLSLGAETCARIRRHGGNPAGRTFLEIGTGRRINLPLALWLLDAAGVITVDVNPYLKYELIQRDLQYIRENRSEIEGLFHGQATFRADRLEDLLRFDFSRRPIGDLLRLCQITYRAPADASRLDVPSRTMDYHVSNQVLEHVPPQDIRAILAEANRVLKDDGLCVHHVDLTDHFSHSDPSISAIHFLQFSDHRWRMYSGNRYMYANRLRIDDFEALFCECGQRVVAVEAEVDRRLADTLARPGEFRLNEKFRGKPADVLATKSAWFVTRPLTSASPRGGEENEPSARGARSA
jgi:SAM-dependent methyltransferase